MRFNIVKLVLGCLSWGTFLQSGLVAQEPASSIPPIKRLLPPEGIEIPADVNERLTKELQAAYQRYEPLKKHELAADIEILLKAVKYAIELREFYDPKDFAKADALLKEANLRIDQLTAGKSPWTTATGTTVRGFFSFTDGSPQPYGLVIPKNFDFTKPTPLYIWLHGRGDKATDLHFITERMSKPGEITPPDAIVAHAFGRQCVGFKHAGEYDIVELRHHLLDRYQIDRQRCVLIGFSMGGAGAWHVGAHYANFFRVIAPGAGFAETARYQKLKPEDYPAWYEQKLWGQYDTPNYVRNLFNSEVIAYSGELDRQIQAARVMEEAYESEGKTLTHLIGPKTEHKYEPKTKAELLKQIAAALEKPRDEWPAKVTLQTRTLAYSAQSWVHVQQLEEHWKDTRVDAEYAGAQYKVTTKNVARLLLRLPPGVRDAAGNVAISLDGQSLTYTRENDLDFCYFGKMAGKWQLDSLDSVNVTGQLRKHPGLQGPIDDAFCRRLFLVVTPSSKSKNAAFQAWQEFELNHFRSRWRALMRGDIREKQDVDMTDEDLRSYNLIVWGDADSNQVIKRVAEKLPIRRTGDKWQVGSETYPAATHTPVLIYPNPFAADLGEVAGYIVLNSGLTFREAHDRTNSLQNPKLPDWAIIDLNQLPDATAPGKIVNAGFFDEAWQLKPK